MHNKVRKVLCPRCRGLLEEPPEVLLYECGGCGTKLQAKRRTNSTVDTTTQRLDEDSSGKRKLDRVSVDQEVGSSSNHQRLLNSSHESDETSDQNDIYSAKKGQDAGKRAENGAVDVSESVVEECSSEKLKIKQLFDDQEPCCSSNPQSLVNSSDEPAEKIDFSGHEDVESSPEAAAHDRIDQEQEQNQNQAQSYYQDADGKQENDAVVKLEHSSSKQKIEQLSDDNAVSSMDELDRKNDLNGSSELSYHDDQESSPEATIHNKVNQADAQFVSGKIETEIEDSSSEFEEAISNTRIVGDSDGGSKLSFKNNIVAEKLLDTRQKGVVYLDEDDLLSEDGSANLHHRQRFDRVSSVETMETARYGYEGSVSSDGNDNETPRKNHIYSGNTFRVNRHNEFHPPLHGRLYKDEHRSMDVRSFYGSNEFHENPSHRSPMIPENSKLERRELLKLVQELKDQLERANISNPQQVPSYHNHVFNNQGRHSQRMAFSGDPTTLNRRQYNSFSHHCYPQDRHFSAQLPGHHHLGSNRPIYRLNTYHTSQFSGSSSSMYNRLESGFSAPDNHQKPFRSPKKKRYVRPIARGSPWITCYRCSKLLELPQSFLVFNKQIHSLRCGACLKVLNFTLSNGTHVSRYYPEDTHAAPPSSEVEDFDKPTDSWAGPVSCSDRSFENDYSTETDRNRSREFSFERRKTTMSRDPTRTPPQRKTSEIETVKPERKGSPLHRLMGYDSPSKVIRSGIDKNSA